MSQADLSARRSAAQKRKAVRAAAHCACAGGFLAVRRAPKSADVAARAAALHARALLRRTLGRWTDRRRVRRLR